MRKLWNYLVSYCNYCGLNVYSILFYYIQYYPHFCCRLFLWNDSIWWTLMGLLNSHRTELGTMCNLTTYQVHVTVMSYQINFHKLKLLSIYNNFILCRYSYTNTNSTIYTLWLIVNSHWLWFCFLFNMNFLLLHTTLVSHFILCTFPIIYFMHIFVFYVSFI